MTTAKLFLLAVALLMTSAATEAQQHVGYFYWEEGASTTLTLVNRNPVSEGAQSVVPLVHFGHRLALELNPVVISPGQQVSVDLGAELESHSDHAVVSVPSIDPLLGSQESWGTGRRLGSAWGSIELLGADGINGAVCTTDDDESLSADGGVIRVARHLALGAWWLPTAETRILTAISNGGPHNIVVRASATGLGGWVTSKHAIRVEAGRTRLVAFDRLFEVANFGTDSGSLKFEVEGGQATMSVSTLTVDDSRGLSVTQDLMLDLAGTPEWNSGTFPMGPIDPAMGFPVGSHFAGKLVLCNGLGQTSAARLTLRAEGESGLSSVAIHEAIVLNAYESKIVDLEGLFGLDGSSQMYTLAVSGRDGLLDLQASLWTVNEGVEDVYDYAFFYPLQAQDRRPENLIVPSVNLSGNMTTQFSLRNTSKNSEILAYDVYDSGGKVTYQVAAVFEAEEFQLVDLRKLRDAGIPDMNGNTLAQDFVEGYVIVSGGPGKLGYNAIIDGPGGTCLMGGCDITSGGDH